MFPEMFFDLNRRPVRFSIPRDGHSVTAPIITPVVSSVNEIAEETPRESPPAPSSVFNCERCRDLHEENRMLLLELEFERAKNLKTQRDDAWREKMEGPSANIDELAASQLSELRQLKRPPPVVKQAMDASLIIRAC